MKIKLAALGYVSQLLILVVWKVSVSKMPMGPGKPGVHLSRAFYCWHRRFPQIRLPCYTAKVNVRFIYKEKKKKNCWQFRTSKTVNIQTIRLLNSQTKYPTVKVIAKIDKILKTS